MSQKIFGNIIIFLLLIIPLMGQNETLLVRFSPAVSPWSLALGGVGVSLYARVDGVFYNPALAATLPMVTLQGNLINDTIAGDWLVQSDAQTKRDFAFTLAGSLQGGRSVTLVWPVRWQSLNLALCGGWQRTLPYGCSGEGVDLWSKTDSGDFVGRTRMGFNGSGALDTVWLGLALAYNETWGLGISRMFWGSEGQWQKRYESDLDDYHWTTQRSERVDGGFWTVGGFFKPVEVVLISAAVHSRTQGDLISTFSGDSIPEGLIADEEYTFPVTLPETLTLGLCLGPFYNSSLHLEYHKQFWSSAALTGHPSGSLYPGMEAGLTSQQDEVLFSLGLSHYFALNPQLTWHLAVGLGWQQPIFSDEQGLPIMLHQLSLGAGLELGINLRFNAGLRFGWGEWNKAGRFVPTKNFLYDFNRTTLMFGIEWFPLGNTREQKE